MRSLNSYLFIALSVVSFLSTFLVESETFKALDPVSSNIESYLESVAFEQEDSSEVTIFSNFLIKENGDFLTVDFMVEVEGEITVLNQEFDEEYYLFDSYSTKQMVTHSSPVATIRPTIIRT